MQCTGMDAFTYFYLPYSLTSYSYYFDDERNEPRENNLVNVTWFSEAQPEFRVLELLKRVIPSSRVYFTVVSENWSRGRAQFLFLLPHQIWRPTCKQLSQALLEEARPGRPGGSHSHVDWASQGRSHRFWLLSSGREPGQGHKR